MDVGRVPSRRCCQTGGVSAGRVGPAARLTEADVGCWVVKSALPPGAVVPGWRPGAVASLDRCVRPSYRLGLMRPGQRVLLWCSGAGSGVRALGTLTSAVAGEPEPDGPHVGVRLLLLGEPVLRADLVGHPAVAGAEVLRVPAGSNPSFLSPTQTGALIDLLDPADLRAAGWLPGARPVRSTPRVEPPARLDPAT